MTLPIGRTATVVLPQVTAIILARAAVLIVLMKVIREREVGRAVTTAQEIPKARVIPQVHAVEQHVRTANQTAVINARMAAALQAILTIAGTTVIATAVDAVAGAAVITAALAALTVLQAVAQAAVVQVQAAVRRPHVGLVN